MPDGARVIFGLWRGGRNLYWRAADGTGTAERLTEGGPDSAPQTLSPDGTQLVYRQGSGSNADLYLLSLDDERHVEPLIATEFRDYNAEISPNGQWLAYQSDASGQNEIYVQPFPDVDDGKWQISTVGGRSPLWGPDGRELFYMTEAGVMGVGVETSRNFVPGTPALVIGGRYSLAGTGRAYDIAPDGRRFLMVKEATPTDGDDPFAGLTQIVVVLNWFEDLKERVPIP